MGKFVLGISRSEVASSIFINACNEFNFLETVSPAKPEPCLLYTSRLDSETEEGRIYAAIEPNIMAELSKIMTGPADQIESSLEAYNKAIHEAGMAKAEAEWTKQYADYSSR